MTERDFDKIFQAKIGDELPFDFRPNDWLAAEHELNKVLPIAVPTVPTARLLTWHKWAAAAAVLFVGSQLFLMTQLNKVNQEIATLHRENAELIADIKKEDGAHKMAQSTVIQHDTIVKTVYIDVSKRENTEGVVLQQNRREAARFDQISMDKNGVNDRREAGDFTQNSNNSKPLALDKLSQKEVPITRPKNLQTIENLTNNNGQKDSFVKEENAINKQNLMGDKKENATNLMDKKDSNLSEINVEKTDKLLEKNSDNLIKNNAENNDIFNQNKIENTVLNALPNSELMAVKSINKNKNWLNDEAFDFILLPKPVIIKPVPTAPNGWEIAVNALTLTNEEHRRPRLHTEPHDDDRVSFGVNLRLAYNLRSKIRLSADADFWSEKHGLDVLTPPANQPLPTENLVGLTQAARSMQLRLGADYKFSQIIGLQPFMGLGIAFQKRFNDDLEFRYKRNNLDLPPISQPNDKPFDAPFSLSLRAGVEGKIYRRLSWAFDINGQGGMKNSQVWITHLGLKYAL